MLLYGLKSFGCLLPREINRLKPVCNLQRLFNCFKFPAKDILKVVRWKIEFCLGNPHAKVRCALYHLFWNAIASTFIQTSLLDNKNKTANKPGREKLNEIFDLEDTKLQAVSESLAQKPNKKLPIIQLFVHYSLLELCLKFCHQSAGLKGFEDVLVYTMDCLVECSVPILQEFINMIQGVVSSYQFSESQYIYHFLASFIN